MDHKIAEIVASLAQAHPSLAVTVLMAARKKATPLQILRDVKAARLKPGDVILSDYLARVVKTIKNEGGEVTVILEQRPGVRGDRVTFRAVAGLDESTIILNPGSAEAGKRSEELKPGDVIVHQGIKRVVTALKRRAPTPDNDFRDVQIIFEPMPARDGAVTMISGTNFLWEAQAPETTSGRTKSTTADREASVKTVFGWLASYKPKTQERLSSTVVAWNDPSYGKFQAIVYAGHVVLWWVTGEPSMSKAFDQGANPNVKTIELKGKKLTTGMLDKAYAQLGQ